VKTRKLLKLILTNFKCYENFQVDLAGGLVLLRGNNGLGKSAVLEALEFLLTADLSGARERAAGLRGNDHLAEFIRRGHNSCTVRLTFEGGFAQVMLRRKRDKKTGKIHVSFDSRGTDVYPDDGATTATQKLKQIERLLSPAIELLRINAFIDLSTRERRQSLTSVLPELDITRDDASTDITMLALKRLGEAPAGDLDIEYVLSVWADGMPFEAARSRMVDAAKFRVSELTQRERDLEGADRTEIERRKTRLAEIFGSLPAKKVERDEALPRKSAYDKALGAARQIRIRFQKLKERIESLQQKEQVPDPEPPQGKSGDELSGELDQLIAERLPESNHETWKDDFRHKQAQFDNLSAERHANLRMMQDRFEIAKAGKCPTCGQVYRMDIGELKAEITSLEREASDIDTVRHKFREQNQEMLQVEINMRAAYDRERNHKKDLQIIQDAREAAKAERLEAEAELNELKIPDVENLKGLAAQTAEQIEKLNEEIGTLEREQQSLINAQENEVDLGDVRRDLKHSRAVAWAVGADGIQGIYLRRQIEPLTESFSNIISSLNPQFSGYIELEDERGAEVCDLGLVRDEQRIDFVSCSDSQQITLLTALAITTAGLASDRMRILLLDRLEALDHGNRLELLNGLARLTAQGDLDLVVGAGAIGEPELNTKWNLIHLKAFDDSYKAEQAKYEPPKPDGEYRPNREARRKHAKGA